MALMEYVKPYVESGDLWLASFSEAAKYYFEWSSAKLTTGGKTADLEIHVDEDGSHFVYANIVPSANISTIRP